MKKNLLLWSVLALLGSIKVYPMGNETGSGGDPLHFLFEDARIAAVSRVQMAMPCAFGADVRPEVRDWIMKNKEALANDISLSAHNWITDQQATCAFTQTTSRAPITLSYNVCRSGVSDISAAALVLIHESVHHFEISNEVFPDEVALAIHNLGVNSSCPVPPLLDPFDPASCPGAPLTAQSLKAMIPLPHQNYKVLGDFKVSVRGRTCYAENWCSAWTEMPRAFSSDLGITPDANFVKGTTTVVLQDNTPQLHFVSLIALTGSDANVYPYNHRWKIFSQINDYHLNSMNAYATVGGGSHGLLTLGGVTLGRNKFTGWVTHQCARQTVKSSRSSKDDRNNDITLEYEMVVLSHFNP